MQIHYFQRYYQKENVVTANSMLLLSRLYTHSPKYFYSLLKSCFLTNESNIGLNITLQTKEKNSVPDAVISQESFKIVIETKLYDVFSLKQLKNHTQSFGDEKYKVLLSLSPGGMDKQIEQVLLKKLQGTGIYHKSMTFNNLIEEIEEVLFGDKDEEMANILDDYRSFCYESGLLPDSWKWLKIRAVNTTYEINTKYNLYYNWAETPGATGYDYLGLYKNKKVSKIGKIIARIIASLEGNEVKYIIEQGEMTEDIEKRISLAIKESQNGYGYRMDKPHRFYIMEEFVKTNYKKTSKGGLWGTKNVNLVEIMGTALNKDTDASEIAKVLEEKTWV